MIALWLLQAIAVGAFLAAAAALADAIARAWGWPQRWIWAMALAATAALPIANALRPTSPVTSVPQRAASASREAPRAEAARLAAARDNAWLSVIVERARPHVPMLARFDRPLMVLWGGTSAALLAAFALAARALARRRREWNEASLEGARVLVATDTGPAVVGALRPRIVLPEWALALPDEERAMMLAHEAEHLRARDPLLLHVAALIVALAPWNLAAWWMLRRLRVAVEVDCDRRVLRAGRDSHAYGSLLLAVGARRARLVPLIAPALLERTSSLAVRITAMHPRRPRFPRAHAALCAVAAAALVFAACETRVAELVAPDGTDMGPKQVYGQRVETVKAVRALSDVVAEYFPEIVRGEVGPSVLFVVADADGRIVGTERIPAEQFGSGNSARSMVTGGASAAAEGARGSRPLSFAGNSARLIKAIDTQDIASVEISKHAAGKFGPNAVSYVYVELKAGAKVPSQVADAGR